MAPLQSAGHELLRNRTRALAETGQFTSELASDDWRVQLGTAQALGRRGLARAPCAPEVRALLKSDAAEVRSLASKALSQAGEETSALSERTRAMLRSPDWRLRKGAVEALGRRGPAAAADHANDVTALLSDIAPQVREAAAEALKQMGCAAARAVAASAYSGKAAGASQKVARDALLLELAKNDGHRVEALACQAQAEAVPAEQVAIRPSKVDVSATAVVERSSVEVVLTDSMLRNSMAPATLDAALAALLNHPDETVRGAVTQLLPQVFVDSSIANSDGRINFTHRIAKEGEPLVPSSPLGPAPSRRPVPARLRTATTVETVRPMSVGSSLGGTGTIPFNQSLRRDLSGASPRCSRGASPTRSEALAMNCSPEMLSEMLDAEAAHVRLRAVKCIAHIALEDPLVYADQIAAKLDDRAARVSVAAAETLGIFGPVAAAYAKAVAGKLDSEQALLRQTCARALGRMQAWNFAEDVAKLLEDADPQVQVEASQALGMIGPEAGAPTAVRLRHLDEGVRMAAFKGFVAMRECSSDPGSSALTEALMAHILPVLSDVQPEARRISSELLERLGATSGAPSVAALCLAARLQDLDEEVRIAAVRGLAALPAHAGPHANALAGALADSAEPVRRAAAEAFSSLGPEHGASAVARMSELLKHALPTVRRATSAAMASMGLAAKEHTASRHAALLADAVPAVRTNAIDGLAKLRQEEAVDPFLIAQVALLHVDRHWSVRLAVAQALLCFGSESLLEHKAALDALCRDEDWRVRRAADAAKRAMPTSAPARNTILDAGLDIDKASELERQVATMAAPEEEKLATTGSSVEEIADNRSCAHLDIELEAAALRIQGAQRRRLADKALARKHAETRRELLEMDASAIKIQRLHRKSLKNRKSGKEANKDHHAPGSVSRSHSTVSRSSSSGHSPRKHGRSHSLHSRTSHKEARSSTRPVVDEAAEEEAAAIRIQRIQRERLSRHSRHSTKHKKHKDEDEQIHEES